MGISPYNKNYVEQKKNQFFWLLGAAIIVVFILVIVFKVVSKKPPTEENIYIGKIVQIQGNFQDIGLVLRYKEGKYIEIKSEESNFNRTAFYRLGENYSLKILADSVEKFEANQKIANENSKKEMQSQNETIEISDEMPKNTPEQNEISETSNTTEKTIQPAETSNVQKNEDILRKFESVIVDIFNNEIKELDSKWNQFVNACLINSDSKKYLLNRKWFQFYEDVANEPPDVEHVDKIKYYDNPSCVMCETEIVGLIKRIVDKLFAAETVWLEVATPIDIREIEERYRILRKEWKNIKPRFILKEKDIRDNPGVIIR